MNKVDGTGLDWLYFMYQGHLFLQKDTYGGYVFFRLLSVEDNDTGLLADLLRYPHRQRLVDGHAPASCLVNFAWGLLQN